MTIFITGANSFIGSEVLRNFRERNVAYSGVDLSPSDDGACEIGDIRDPDISDLIPEGVDAIVHLAALSRAADCRDKARECFDINVMGTLNMMDAAQKRNAGQFIFASSEWVYDTFDPGCDRVEDDPIDISKLNSEYAISKLVSEVNLKQKYGYGFCSTTILRFGIVYGSRKVNWSAVEALFESVATSDSVTVGSLATARRFVHVSDIANGIIAAIGTPGCETINIQGRELITLGKIIQTSSTILGKSPKINENSPETPSIRNVSSEKAERLLGWQANTDLMKGLQQFHKFLASSTA